jgi:hypothetical protein
MGINTDLNVDPYYDDFSEAKQFNRILFKPAKAVQARELTQLQTILQKQVERFGSNIYKEGTIISGINLTARDDLFYVKVNDQAGFNNPALYDQVKDADGITTSYTITGQTSGLVAEIVKGQSGFQTQDPDLKTFYIKYLNTVQDGTVDVKQFQAGESLVISDKFAVQQVTVTAATVANNVGRSFGVSCEEGVLFQKGHFIFVDSQFIIVSKYTNTPGTVSVGFTIEENLINSNNDSSLLDNAAGFNNENAPGADRLQLVPTLVSYNTATEPTEFFALIRYVDGNAVRIRDRTEFNSINSELARRTYDESGNYVTRGLNVTLQQSGDDAYAVVSPGKAYVYGNEVINISAKRLLIDPNTLTQSKSSQYTGVSYGQYYTYNHTSGQVLNSFALNGSRYRIYNDSDVIIGTCSITNVTPGKIYVYAIRKLAGQENVTPFRIENTVLTNSGALFEVNANGKIFDAGKSSMSSISNVAFVQRKSISVTPGVDNTVVLSPTSREQPLTSNIFGVTSVNTILTATSSVTGADVTVTLSGANATTLYYDAIVTGVQEDSLQELDVYVKSVYVNGKASIGLPNAIQILEVLDSFGGTGAADVTGKFRLINNQKDHFYDISHITLKAGETLANSNLRIRVKVLRRTSTVGSGFLTINSYDNVTNKDLVQPYIGKNGIEFNLLNSYDFRQYANPVVPYDTGASGAATVVESDLSLNLGIQPASDSNISATQEYYMSRIDSVVLDEFGVISLYKGGEAENPSRPALSGLYALNNIFVPGNQLKITGNNSIQLQDVSNKAYTMRDIGDIDKKIDRLVDLVSISLLENETKDFFIPDGMGQSRFKNGILVDSFKNLVAGEISDPEFKAAIDKTRTVATPAVTQFPVDLKIGSSSGANLFQDVATLADNGTRVKIIDQPYATAFRNCVSNFYSYQGKASILPPFDAGYNVIKNPAVEFEIDFATPLLDLVDNIQEMIPLVRESNVGGPVFTGFSGQARGRVENLSQSVQVSQLSATTNQFSKTVGNFITDVNMKPYVQSREVKILVTGLRPNARHYFYFEQSPVSAHVYPGTINLTTSGSNTEYNVANVQIAGAKGAAVRTNAEGTLTAVFMIPAETFFVGENTLEIVDVDTYTSVDSAKTSYSKATYRAFNFDIGKSDLNFTTRTVDFGIESSIVQRQFTRAAPTDPIAQTFKIRTGQANGASVVMLSDIDVFFKSKSFTVGATMEIREVVNGYPSSTVLPFGRKHLRSNQITVSDNGTVATNFEFKNPVKLNVEKEYCFVIIPDANSPDFLIWTSKVGGTDVASGTAITNDWGDGVLFTSTNDSAWKSYQDEDIKFSINRYDFTTATGHINLVPNDVEFLTIRGTVNSFLNDELAYVLKGTNYSASVSGSTLQTVTISGTPIFAQGDYIYLASGTNKFLSKIASVTTAVVQGATTTVITLETPYTSTATTSATAYVCVAGRVTYFNSRKPDRLFLKGSSANALNFIDDNAPTSIGSFIVGNTYTITNVGTSNWTAVGVSGTPALGTVFVATTVGTAAGGGTARNNSQVITGYNSGATASVTSVDNEGVSYFQPQIYVDNSIRTSTELTLYEGNLADKIIPSNGNVYLINNTRVINSKSNIVNPSIGDSDDFSIRVSMDNGGYSSATPIVDADLSILNVYKYQITSATGTTSKWVSKEIILQDGLDANGMKVYLTAYRPAGTLIDVYARFTYPTNVEVRSAWIPLDNKNPDMYSNSSNTSDYRQFEYDLNEAENPNAYSSFQLRIVMRHATQAELNAKDLTVVPSVSLFPHVYDYRAIAVT